MQERKKNLLFYFKKYGFFQYFYHFFQVSKYNRQPSRHGRFVMMEQHGRDGENMQSPFKHSLNGPTKHDLPSTQPISPSSISPALEKLF